MSNVSIIVHVIVEFSCIVDGRSGCDPVVVEGNDPIARQRGCSKEMQDSMIFMPVKKITYQCMPCYRNIGIRAHKLGKVESTTGRRECIVCKTKDPFSAYLRIFVWKDSFSNSITILFEIATQSIRNG